MQVYAQREETRTDGADLRIEGGFSKIIASTRVNIFCYCYYKGPVSILSCEEILAAIQSFFRYDCNKPQRLL